MTAERPRAVVSWSSGKDAAFALWLVRQRKESEVVGLLTTTTADFERVSMHGVREALLRRQAEVTGLPLYEVRIPYPCPNEVYEARMSEAILRLREDRVSQMIFGDLFLQDIRSYRESRLAGTGIEPVFPLWGLDTAPLAHRMIREGLEARIVCVDPRKISPRFAGRRFDGTFLSELPSTADPCGENGEFHTFVCNGPMFREPIPVRDGETVERDGFVFHDLLPE